MAFLLVMSPQLLGDTPCSLATAETVMPGCMVCSTMVAPLSGRNGGCSSVDNAELGKVASQRVHQRRPLPDQQLTGAVHHQRRLLPISLVGTGYMLDRITASLIASESAASILPRLR